ncbi:hypothetical protein V8E53_008373 [Lactarius tabidus]|jgi:hypothetical protein
MSPLLPAVRAHQAVRHPASDVGNSLSIDSSPGARGIILFDRYLDRNYEQGPDPDSLPPVPPVSSGQGPPITTAVQGSSVVESPTVSQGPSPSNSLPTSTYPARINLSGTLSSSSPPATTTSTPQKTGVRFPGPRLGSTVLPAMVATTPSADPNPVLAGSTSEARNHPGLSAGAIAAIVIVVLLAMGALAFFLLRGRLIQRRTARRATWTANAWGHPTADTSSEKGATETHPRSISDVGAAPGATSTHGNEGGSAQLQVLIIPRKSPPPYIPQTGEVPVTQLRSHNSPVYSSMPSPQPSAVRMVASESTQDPMALVRVTFVPQLPDELAITPGETVYIHTEFDDGWALCANTRGEHGMVPLECLECGRGQFAEFPPPSVNWHNRDSRRVSSLRSPVT